MDPGLQDLLPLPHWDKWQGGMFNLGFGLNRSHDPSSVSCPVYEGIAPGSDFPEGILAPPEVAARPGVTSCVPEVLVALGSAATRV